MIEHYPGFGADLETVVAMGNRTWLRDRTDPGHPAYDPAFVGKVQMAAGRIRAVLAQIAERAAGRPGPWPEPGRPISAIAAMGPALWGRLHRWALGYAGDEARARAWLEAFTRSVPCSLCRADWERLVAAHPPDFTDARSLFAWTVARHNDLNRKLDKPEVTAEAARKIWTPSLPGADPSGP